jgi:hypothetical protein
MATRVEADVEVPRFGYVGDDTASRLVFPHAHAHKLEGRAGETSFGVGEATFEALDGRLDTLRWTSAAASIGGAWLRDDDGRFQLAIERTELPHGIRLVRAEQGVELVSPHLTCSELRLELKGPFRTRAATTPPEPAAPPPLRQSSLRFLDSLSGRIYLTVKVELDLPVLGSRTLDQELRVPVQDGSLDFRALEESLDWLEGAFLDIEHHGDRLAVRWKVPIFGSRHDLISWALDADASALAAFGRVPVRSLADFRLGRGDPDDKPADKKRKILQAFTLDAIDVALSLLAPRNLEVGSGVIMFGGDDQPGLVDLKVSGAIHDRGAGALRGAIGSIDTTVKDLRIGPLILTADRLHFDGLDQLEVAFDGFSPTAITVVIHRVTATNLSIQIAR